FATETRDLLDRTSGRLTSSCEGCGVLDSGPLCSQSKPADLFRDRECSYGRLRRQTQLVQQAAKVGGVGRCDRADEMVSANVDATLLCGQLSRPHKGDAERTRRPGRGAWHGGIPGQLGDGDCLDDPGLLSCAVLRAGANGTPDLRKRGSQLIQHSRGNALRLDQE